jgi:hypothetical protein
MERVRGMADPVPSSQDGRPVLHFSGEKLRIALTRLTRAAEPVGGIERYAAAVQLKAEVFRDRLGEGKAATVTRGEFEEIVPLMATVRRRFDALADAVGWQTLQAAIVDLLRDAHVPGTADSRMATFERATAAAYLARAAGRDGERAPGTRFLRDLAAEVLHGVLPEHYPLMTRWVWDAKVNTGVLREIWHDPVAGEDLDRVLIDVPDGHETFLVLREELSQFLSANGIFRDMPWYVDLLCAQVYGDYVAAQGGAYLKADFVTEGDPLEHSRRILGLDRIGRRRGRRLDSEAIDIDRLKRLS